MGGFSLCSHMSCTEPDRWGRLKKDFQNLFCVATRTPKEHTTQKPSIRENPTLKNRGLYCCALNSQIQVTRTPSAHLSPQHPVSHQYPLSPPWSPTPPQSPTSPQSPTPPQSPPAPNAPIRPPWSPAPPHPAQASHRRRRAGRAAAGSTP